MVANQVTEPGYPPQIVLRYTKTVSFFHAWRVWFAGQPTASLIMWGHPVLWWGRAGKIAEYLGALVAVVDIVGPQRMRTFGKSLRRRSTAAQDGLLGAVAARAGQTFREVRSYFEYWFASYTYARKGPGPIVPGVYRTKPKRPDLSKDAKVAIRLFGTVFWIGLIAFYLWTFTHPNSGSRSDDSATRSWWFLLLTPVITFGTLTALFALVAAIPTVFAMLSTFGRLLLAVPSGVIYYLAIRPMVWLLDRKNPDVSFKGLGLTAVALGFPFDLLSN